MSSPTIIRWKDVEPSWHLPRQEPGFLRWITSWVAGPEGHVNSNPGLAVISQNASVGYMQIPAGNSMRGWHYHSVTEVYIVLRGQVLGWDGNGKTHIAGPLDCMYTPKGVPHGVRAYGDGPVDFIWLHDDIEKKGVSKYWTQDMPNPQDESKEEVKVVHFNDLKPRWDAQEVGKPGEMHSMINWVGGVPGSVNFNPENAIHNEKIAVGLMIIPEGQRQETTGRDNAELCVVVRGKAVVKIDGKNEELGKLDAVYLPAGTARTIRNHGDEPAYIVWIHEKTTPTTIVTPSN